MRTKFDIGDKVTVLDGSADITYTCGWALGMNDFVGKTVTIDGVAIDKNRQAYSIEGCDDYLFDGRYLSRIEPVFYNGKIRILTPNNVLACNRTYEIKEGQLETEWCGRVPDRFDPDGALRDFEDVKDFFAGDGKRKRQRGWSSKAIEIEEANDNYTL